MNDLDLSRSQLFSTGKYVEQGFRNASLASRFSSYRGRIAGSYRAVTAEEMATIPSGGWASLKIDGELWFLVLGGGDPFLVSPRGNVIIGEIPVLAAACSASAKVDGLTIIAGELHAEVTGRRCRVGDLSALFGEGAQAEGGRLRFSAFDILPEQEAPTSGYGDRWAELNRLFGSDSCLSVAATFELNEEVTLAALYEEHVASGNYEGLVVRARDGMIYKLKPSHTIDAAILGYTVKAESEDGVRSVLLGLMHEDGRFQVWGACGNLGAAQDRKTLLAQLASIRSDSQYRYASDSGGLYFFVKPELVAEIKVTDLQGERSDGTPITSMVLEFSAGVWRPQCPRSMASPLHPVMIRLRGDKTVSPTDVRMAQIGDWLVRKDSAESQAELPKSSVLRREAWKKETKGKLAVRKLLVWKTNKEEQNSAFPAYVVHWTDYSAGRGSPLDREVRLAMDEGTAMQIADKMVADNIKKGWERV